MKQLARLPARLAVGWLGLLVAVGCSDPVPGGDAATDTGGDGDVSGHPAADAFDAGDGSSPDLSLPYATEVVDFSPGDGAGYGRAWLPGVVLGPPDGASSSQPATRVLTLGEGGTITLAFGDRAASDGPGDDLIVFENAFGDWVELGRVSVSADGETWKTFSCNRQGTEEGTYPGCAGWTPTEPYDVQKLVPPDPAETGGDSFDLSDVGLDRATHVRIRGISDRGLSDTKRGFDLDAVGIVHPVER